MHSPAGIIAGVGMKPGTFEKLLGDALVLV
jgi:hypothetical protein